MVDEHNEINPATGGEEEYHFNDENPEYDLSAAATETAKPAGGKKFSAFFQDRRRIVVGAFVFLMLVGVVYKMLAPSSSSGPATDIVAPPADKTASSAAKPVTAAAIQPAPAQTNNTPATAAIEPPAEPQAAQAPAAVPTASPTPTPAAAPVEVPQQQPYVPEQPTPESNNAINSLSNRINGLEQQNMAILNTMETKYGQKISDVEAQNNQMQQELQELKSDVKEVKQAFHQLSAMLQKEASGGAETTASKSTSVDAVGSAAAKSIKTGKETGYTVQAIIPGRAWLKSASGDTVTVAEGDTLRGVGRVVRIDPYDGIVNLDTGNKTITLSYGMGADD